MNLFSFLSVCIPNTNVKIFVSRYKLINFKVGTSNNEIERYLTKSIRKIRLANSGTAIVLYLD